MLRNYSSESLELITISMEYLCFIQGWNVQVTGRDVDQHTQDADYHGLHRLVDPDNANLE